MKKEEIIEVLKKHSVNYPFGNAICQSDFESIATELSGGEDKISDEDIEKWLDAEYPLYKYPKNRREKKVNTMTCLVRDGIRYSLKAYRDGQIKTK